MPRSFPRRPAAVLVLAATAGLSLGGVDAAVASVDGRGGSWLLVPLLLDFQPALVPIDTSRRLTEQLEWFCRVHGLGEEQCAAGISSGLAQVVDIDLDCRHPEAGSQLPGFLTVRNVFSTNTRGHSGQPSAKWRQGDASNIARGLCRFAHEHNVAEHVEGSTSEECAVALATMLNASFDWILAREPCEQPALQKESEDGKLDRTGIAAALREKLPAHIGLRDPSEHEFASPGGTKEASGIEAEPITLVAPQVESSAQATRSAELQAEPRRDPGNSTAAPVEFERANKRAMNFFDELHLLPMAATARYAGHFEPQQWLAALLLLLLLPTVYLAVDVVSRYVRKPRQGGSKVHAGSPKCVSSSEDWDVSKSLARIPSTSETRSPEGAKADASSFGAPEDGAVSPFAPLPALQQADSSSRRARAWSSPCLNPCLDSQRNLQRGGRLVSQPARSAAQSSLYRALSRSGGAQGGSDSRCPSFTRAAMAVMMTRPSAVLPPKRTLDATPGASVSSPASLVSALVAVQDSARCPRQLVAALRLQRIWRSGSSAVGDESASNAGAGGGSEQ